MPTTVDDIRRWIERGIEEGATDMLVICDTFDYDDYPVYFDSSLRARERANNPGSMQKIMEAYNLKGDIEAQLDLRRCYQFSDNV